MSMMENGILLKKVSRKKEKLIIGIISLIVLILNVIYVSNLVDYGTLTLMVCGIITTISGTFLLLQFFD